MSVFCHITFMFLIYTYSIIKSIICGIYLVLKHLAQYDKYQASSVAFIWALAYCCPILKYVQSAKYITISIFTHLNSHTPTHTHAHTPTHSHAHPHPHAVNDFVKSCERANEVNSITKLRCFVMFTCISFHVIIKRHTPFPTWKLWSRKTNLRICAPVSKLWAMHANILETRGGGESKQTV